MGSQVQHCLQWVNCSVFLSGVQEKVWDHCFYTLIRLHIGSTSCSFLEFIQLVKYDLSWSREADKVGGISVTVWLIHLLFSQWPCWYRWWVV